MTVTRQPSGTGAPVSATKPARPRRPLLIVGSVAVGLAIAVLWSAQLVDDDIGVNTANGILGRTATNANLTGTVTSLVFAIVTGLAGTFTACNVAVFSAIAPMLDADRASVSSRLRKAFAPLGWTSLGAAVIAGAYGAIGAAVGTRLPQLSTTTVGSVPVKTLQSITVFGVIGLIMLYLGLASLDLVPDPLARASARWAPTRQVVLGALIGGFLIGRPWPLFHKVFLHAATTHNAALGAGVLVLVVLGNMTVMGVLFLLLAVSGLPRWLRGRAHRVTSVTAAALLVGGTFTFAYWCLRVPSHFGFGWFPQAPWS